MAFIGQVRQGIAKAIQIASDNTVYTELPECSPLCQAQTLSIKPVDPLDITRTSEKFTNRGETYVRIKFLIRNEKMGKNTILNAELISGRGFVVKTIDGSNIMDVRLADSSSRSFGKILHPSQATIYKVIPTPGSRFEVFQTGIKSPILTVEKVFLSLYPVAKMLGLLNSECVYWFKSPESRILGYIRPKIVLNGKTLIIKFNSNQNDAKRKTAMVGVALLMLLHDVYPELCKILEAGVHYFSNSNKI